MKTIVILFLLFPLLAYALRCLYLYVAHFQENKCGSCPCACNPAQKARCAKPPEISGLPRR